MECPACGRYAPPDPDTGYDADDICPQCARDGWTVDTNGEPIQDLPKRPDYVVILIPNEERICHIHNLPEPCIDCARLGHPDSGETDCPF